MMIIKYFVIGDFRSSCSSVEWLKGYMLMLKGYMLNSRNAERVHGKQKVWEPLI